MRTSHELLLRLFFDPGYDFSRVSVDYVDRGAPQDTSVAQGEQIARLDSQYMEIRNERGVTCIPYHRVLRIRYGNETLWDRLAARRREGEGSPE